VQIFIPRDPQRRRSHPQSYSLSTTTFASAVLFSVNDDVHIRSLILCPSHSTSKRLQTHSLTLNPPTPTVSLSLTLSLSRLRPQIRVSLVPHTQPQEDSVHRFASLLFLILLCNHRPQSHSQPLCRNRRSFFHEIYK
jgi:hypothetical protein